LALVVHDIFDTYTIQIQMLLFSPWTFRYVKCTFKRQRICQTCTQTCWSVNRL